jgi:predicted nucleic acid-binding protein
MGSDLPFVFDCFPILVLLEKQKGWEIVRDIIDETMDGNILHVMSAINYGEVFYGAINEHGEAAAMESLALVNQFPIEIILPTMEHVTQAARFKSLGGISYADCFAAALALERDIPVLTGDPEFHILESRGVKVKWLPKNR